MKRILSLVCVLSLVLSLGILPVGAVDLTGNSMTLKNVYLRTQETKEGIYFGASFKLSQDTVDNMVRYGLAVTPYEMADDTAWANNMDGAVQRSKYNTKPTANQSTYVRSTSLVNIINISNDSLTNNRNAATSVNVRPYVEMADGSYLFGEGGSISMKYVAQMVDEIYDTLDNTQKQGLLGMYERFSGIMKGWGLTNLKAHYTSGGYVNVDGKDISLILKYRQEKVVANMKEQTEVVWTVETENGQPLVYSRAPKSAGTATDDLDVVYTLYPGRIYVGLPYTHGSSSKEMFYSRATLENGVYVIKNANASLFNGGSTNGSSTNGAYNTARLGNDCWDAISWAYESIGSSVSADQTNQLVASNGMYPVGEYDITPCLTSTGVIDDPKSIYTALSASGDLQVMYRSYALLQPGYTLVNASHSLMVTGVSVVYNADGTVNPTASTVSFMDQGSGKEKAQSLLDTSFTGTFTSSGANGHSSGHVYESLGNLKVGDPNKCEQCAVAAGYDKNTGRFVISNQGMTWTFEKAFAEDGYIPVAPKELTDPTCTPSASRISDSKSTADISGIYTGTLTSTYRVQKITLDIFDMNGNKVNASECLGIQNGVTNGFVIGRFLTDQTAGAYGSVLVGTPALVRDSYTYDVTDENGDPVYVYTKNANGTYYYDETSGTYLEVTGSEPEGTTLYTKSQKTATNYWLEAPDLPVGEYYYEMTCLLGNGYTKTFRDGYFLVTEGTDQNGNSAHLVTAS